MLKWDSVFDWRRRGSDRPAPARPARTRDRLLESIIAHEQVEILYQPLMVPRTGRIVGVEALARATITATADDLFVRAAAAELDERLSRLVQRMALRRAAVWEGPLKGLSLSINILPVEISREGYESWLLEEIAAAGIEPSRVTAEITESALLVDRAAVAERLARLRQAGVRIALDDFGTGYASLSYLASLPLDMLKIDRSLVANVVAGERDRIVIGAIVRLARDLGLTVLVEGVESTAQLELLCEWGCDLYQGFLGAGPLSQEELARFVATTQREAA